MIRYQHKTGFVPDCSCSPGLSDAALPVAANDSAQSGALITPASSPTQSLNFSFFIAKKC